MCRKSQLRGLSLACFGGGLLLGLWLEGGFLPVCLGLGCIIFGLCLAAKN